MAPPDAMKTTASCRLTREERALVEAACARSGHDYISAFMKGALMDRVREVLGDGVLAGVGSEDGGGE